MHSLFARIRKTVPTGPDGLVWWLSLVMSLGVTAVLPVLPLYASERGADLHFIGLMVAAYMGVNLLCLYPAGWLSDRSGRRLLMSLGLVAFGLSTLGFLVFRDPWVFVILRGIEGVAGACFAPAALAYVADRAPEGLRGERIASLSVAQNVGVLAGPVVGGWLATAFGLASPFLVMATLCVVGGAIVVRLPVSGPHAVPPDAEGEEGVSDWRLVQWGPALGLMARSIVGGFAMGLYETIWPIFMTDRGASAWDVSMSWTAFAVPCIFLATMAGRWIDRSGPGRPAVWGSVVQAVAVFAYGFTGRVDLLLVVCLLEGVGFAFSNAALNALNVGVAPASMRGRMIGLIAAVRTGGALVGALVAAPLFHWSVVGCFVGTSIATVASSALLAFGLWWGRRPSPATSRPSPAFETVSSSDQAA